MEDCKFNLEMQWILQSQLSPFCEELQKQLQDSLNFILKSSKKGSNGEELISDKLPEIADDDEVLQMIDSRLTTYENANGQLKGFVALDGCFISEAEVIITKFKTLPRFKTQINGNNPWRLLQIQNIVNYLKSSLAYLNEKLFDSKNKKLKEELEAKSDRPLQSSQVLQIIKTVTTIRNNLRTAIDNLVSPLDTIEQDFQVFSPKILDDLVINIVIKNNCLLLTVEQFDKGNIKTTDSILDNMKLLSESKLSSQKPNQRLNYAFCEIKIPKFDTIMTLLLQSWDLCSNLLDKLKVSGF
jgi:hypothetical protein